MGESWKLTLPCTRAEAERLAGDVPELDGLEPTPVITVSEPDERQPDRWRLDIYFEGRPPRILLKRLVQLVPSARRLEPKAVRLPDADWVTQSQAGLKPLDAGRFHVRTPDHPPAPNKLNLVIPAGLAFGTGQHATTAGCLHVLDALKGRGRVYRNVLDLGTGTGLLAFAARRLWPAASLTASDIDPVSITVTRENMALNAIRGIDLLVADGLAHRGLRARAPYDLIIANILAWPLIQMAPQIAASLASRGTVVLAGLLDGQAQAVARAYTREGLRVGTSSGGEWPVLTLRAR